jgi:FixJ family two-component response regulator
MARTSTHEMTGALVASAPAKPDSLCIIDDDASVRKSIAQLLDSDQLKSRSFEDPEDFLVHATKHMVLLAVLDVWMPKMNGLEVQARLRKVSPETKVIVISANAVPEMRAAALKVGAIAFLEKPFDDELFLFLVRQALRSVSNDLEEPCFYLAGQLDATNPLAS